MPGIPTFAVRASPRWNAATTWSVVGPPGGRASSVRCGLTKKPGQRPGLQVFPSGGGCRQGTQTGLGRSVNWAQRVATGQQAHQVIRMAGHWKTNSQRACITVNRTPSIRPALSGLLQK